MRRYAAFVGVLLAVFVLSVNHAAGQDTPQPKKAAVAAKEQPENEAVTKLLKTQLQAAKKAYQASVDTMAVQRVGGLLVQVQGDTKARPDLVHSWSVRWMQAQDDLSETKEQRIAAFVDHQKRMKELLANVKTIVGDSKGGILRASEVPAAEWYLAEADLWLLKEQAK
jgi:hypothetical protein